MHKLKVLCGLGLVLALVSGCGREELNTANSLIGSQASDDESVELGKNQSDSRGEKVKNSKRKKKMRWESRSNVVRRVMPQRIQS